jgi:tetratricopeptide (TPR) repeat protein
MLAHTIAALALSAMIQAPDSVPLYTNLGSHHHPITTSVPRAQQYFDQGLRLTYAFNHAEAIASFEQATRLDPRCAMCWWGIAYAYGPNINAAMDSASGVAAYRAAQRALFLVSEVSTPEQAYIRALVLRYGPDPRAPRAPLDSAYAQAMGDVARAFPLDDDASTLWAESLMDLSPWIYWTSDRRPRPGTPEMLAALERVVERNHQHAGACHYYIHAVEATYPRKAEACADRLAALMPGAGHIVHMPGHIYVRIGRYADAIAANKHAIHEDESFIADRNPQGVYPLGYYPHNYHFLHFAAMMAGDAQLALSSAKHLAAKTDAKLMRLPGMGAMQHYSVAPLFAHIRFSQWQDILAMPAPAGDLVYPTGLWRFARGTAFARMGNVKSATAELAALRTAAAQPDLRNMAILSYNTAAGVLGILTAILEGEILAADGDLVAAGQHLRHAVELEDNLVYIEPPELPVPARQHLGFAMLRGKRPAAAEKAFREDLEIFPENVWSLRGLAEALDAQGNTREAGDVRVRLEKALKGTGARHHGSHGSGTSAADHLPGS